MQENSFAYACKSIGLFEEIWSLYVVSCLVTVRGRERMLSKHRLKYEDRNSPLFHQGNTARRSLVLVVQQYLL